MRIKVGYLQPYIPQERENASPKHSPSLGLGEAPFYVFSSGAPSRAQAEMQKHIPGFPPLTKKMQYTCRQEKNVLSPALTKKPHQEILVRFYFALRSDYSAAGTWMMPTGHSLTHSWQPTHLSWSMWARLLTMVMASLGHFLAHFWQPIQPAVQALRVSPPLSSF